MGQGTRKAAGRDDVEAAGRLMQMRKAGESDADFARRIGLESQHIWNYKNGKGLGLTALAKVASRLSARDLVFVVAGKRSPATDSAIDYADGVRDAAAAMQSTIDNLLEAASPPTLGGGDRAQSARERGRGAARKRRGAEGE